MNLNEDLKKHTEQKRREAEEREAEELRLKEEERIYNRENKVRTESGSIARVGGRPVGSKNKSTLFKEAMKQGFEEVLEKEGKEVFIAVCQRAKGQLVRDESGEIVRDEYGNKLYEGGSDSAAKLIMDRIVPVADIDKMNGNEKFNININVSGLNASVDVMDGEFEEIDDAT